MSDHDKKTPDENTHEAPRFLEGYFLISEVELMDPNFYRTVVLLVKHDEEGAFGLVVNRRSNVTLGELVEGFEDSEARSLPIHVGGPVQQEFMFTLHSGLPDQLRSEHASTPSPGVVFEPVTESVVEYLRDEWITLPANERPKIHLFAGYSGWGAGQLEGELEAKAWVIMPATSDLVFYPNPAEGWRQALGRKGAFYKIVAETGFKPSMN
ncbi:MAG TPA: YqgE/AlgH family protein [Spirochaetia bacterium]|nr:YqgE/AlgH family protein [Spirochaetia bacterium]